MNQPLGFPEPAKPPAEMTSEELRVWRRDFRRSLRDQEVAAGIRAPRTQRETRIWQDSLHVLEERRQGRAAGLPEDELPPLPYELPPGPLLPQAEPVAERSRRADADP